MFGAHSRRNCLSPVPDLSGPSPVQARLYLPLRCTSPYGTLRASLRLFESAPGGFVTQTMATAMVVALAPRPNALGLRGHPGYWCNIQVNAAGGRITRGMRADLPGRHHVLRPGFSLPACACHSAHRCFSALPLIPLRYSVAPENASPGRRRPVIESDQRGRRSVDNN